MLTPDTCGCRKKPGYDPDFDQCPVCDWGLGVCAKCGAAEIDLYDPCKPKAEAK